MASRGRRAIPGVVVFGLEGDAQEGCAGSVAAPGQVAQAEPAVGKSCQRPDKMAIGTQAHQDESMRPGCAWIAGDGAENPVGDEEMAFLVGDHLVRVDSVAVPFVQLVRKCANRGRRRALSRSVGFSGVWDIPYGDRGPPRRVRGALQIAPDDVASPSQRSSCAPGRTPMTSAAAGFRDDAGGRVGNRTA